jgi:hypothetical protein
MVADPFAVTELIVVAASQIEAWARVPGELIARHTIANGPSKNAAQRG